MAANVSHHISSVFISGSDKIGCPSFLMILYVGPCFDYEFLQRAIIDTSIRSKSPQNFFCIKSFVVFSQCKSSWISIL